MKGHGKFASYQGQDMNYIDVKLERIFFWKCRFNHLAPLEMKVKLQSYDEGRGGRGRGGGRGGAEGGAGGWKLLHVSLGYIQKNSMLEILRKIPCTSTIKSAL